MFDSHKIDDYFDGKRPFDNAKTDDKPKTSGWLRFVKLGFPCLAAAIFGVMLVMPNIKKSVDLQNDITVPRKNEMEKLHIEETVYYATDAKNRVSTVHADSVDEVAPGSQEVQINNPKAQIAADNGNWNIASKIGFFNQGTNLLKLNGRVVAQNEDGTVVKTETVFYDFNAEYGHGEQLVEADGKWGDLEAASFEYFKLKNILVLKGRHIINTSQGILTAEKETRFFQNEHKSVSQGNVIVRKDNNVFYADVVTAYYTAKNELERVEADGNIRILMSKGSPVGLAPKQNSGMAQASAEAFEYMKNGNILVLKGPHVITTSDGVLTAEQETRYFQDAQKSVSIGNVVIKQADNTLRADMMTAYYGKNNELKKVEATGNVKVVTPKGTAVGEKGIYTPDNAKVELIGKVQIEQQGNFINGDRAETDLNTQISKITGDKKTGGRISGTFYSKRKTENEQK